MRQGFPAPGLARSRPASAKGGEGEPREKREQRERAPRGPGQRPSASPPKTPRPVPTPAEVFPPRRRSAAPPDGQPRQPREERGEREERETQSERSEEPEGREGRERREEEVDPPGGTASDGGVEGGPGDGAEHA